MLIPVVLLLLLDPVYSRGSGPLSSQGHSPGDTGITEDSRQDGFTPKGPDRQPDEEGPAGVDEGRGAPGEMSPGKASGSMPQPPGGEEDRGGPPGDIGETPDRSPLRIAPSTLISLLDEDSGQEGPLSLSNSDSLLNRNTRALAGMIETASDPDQIFSANSDPLDSLLTGLTGRASTGGMLHEVQPDESESGIENVKNASLVVIPSRPQGATPGDQGTERVEMSERPSTDGETEGMPQMPEELSSLEYVGSSGQFSLYLNPEAEAQREISGAVIPWFVVFSLLGLALALIITDSVHPLRLKRRRVNGEGD